MTKLSTIYSDCYTNSCRSLIYYIFFFTKLLNCLELGAIWLNYLNAAIARHLQLEYHRRLK